MILQDAIDKLQDATAQSKSSYKKKLIGRFTGVLERLKERPLEPEQILKIEEQLETLAFDFNNKQAKKKIKKSFNGLNSFLQKEFNWVIAGHYTTMGLLYGIVFGSAVGSAIGTAMSPGKGTAIGMSMGPGVGLAIGMAIGAAFEAKAKKEGRVI